MLLQEQEQEQDQEQEQLAKLAELATLEDQKEIFFHLEKQNPLFDDKDILLDESNGQHKYECFF